MELEELLEKREKIHHEYTRGYYSREVRRRSFVIQHLEEYSPIWSTICVVIALPWLAFVGFDTPIITSCLCIYATGVVLKSEDAGIAMNRLAKEGDDANEAYKKESAILESDILSAEIAAEEEKVKESKL